MADTESIFSTSSTLVNTPHLVRSGSSRSQAGASNAPEAALLPPEDVQMALFIAYDNNIMMPEASRLARAGFPAQTTRGNSTPGIGLFSSMRKRLMVQIPRAYLQDESKIEYLPDPVTASEALERRRAFEPKRAGTVWDYLGADVVRIRARRRLELVLQVCFRCMGTRDPLVIIPRQRINAVPARLGQPDGSAKLSVRWATLQMLSPPPAGQKTNTFDEAVASRGTKTNETGEELLAKMFVPLEEAERTLDDVLAHLERRGGIFTNAGHYCQPSGRNPRPWERPEFIVLGLFPEELLQRFKRYRARDCMPMPHESESAGKEKETERVALLDVESPRESRENVGKGDMEAAMGTELGEQAAKDPLQGWTVGVTLEPLMTGSPWGTMMGPGTGSIGMGG